MKNFDSIVNYLRICETPKLASTEEKQVIDFYEAQPVVPHIVFKNDVRALPTIFETLEIISRKVKALYRQGSRLYVENLILETTYEISAYRETLASFLRTKNLLYTSLVRGRLKNLLAVTGACEVELRMRIMAIEDLKVEIAQSSPNEIFEAYIFIPAPLRHLCWPIIKSHKSAA